MTTIKNIKNLFIIAVISLVPLASFAQAFEGVVEMTTTNRTIGETANVKWYIKNGNSKMVINTNTKGTSMQYAVIFRKGDATAHLVLQDAVSDIPVSQMAGKSPIQIGTGGIAKGVGEKTVASFPCTALINTKGQITAWVSEKTGVTVNDLPEVMRSQGTLNILASFGINGIPMEVINYDDKGEVSFTQTITNIKASKVSDKEFDTSGYRSAEEVAKEANSAK